MKERCSLCVMEGRGRIAHFVTQSRGVVHVLHLLATAHAKNLHASIIISIQNPTIPE